MHFSSRVLVPEDLRYFSDSQLARPGFPFSRMTSETWISRMSRMSGDAVARFC